LHSGPETHAKPPRKGLDMFTTDSYEAESDILTIGLIGMVLVAAPRSYNRV